jgi:hypothetical protein
MSAEHSCNLRPDVLQRDERRERVYPLYLKGVPQQETAAREKINQGTVSRDLQAIRRRWQESCNHLLAEDRAKELARIDLLESTYWQAWERSLCEKTRSKSRRRTGEASYDKVGLEREERV